MTIGIATVGPNAGLGLFKGLRAAERVGTGSIGGFATFAAITADRRLIRAQTQRGGSGTLFLDGETTGVDPSGDVAAAPYAGVISSGPERPDLVKLVSADPAVGLVTGHRLPIQQGVDGMPLNEQVLDLMRHGASAQAAVDTVLDRNPQSDAGLIAIGRAGDLYGRNSARVLKRPDLAEFRAESPRGSAKVVVFYNSIRPLSVIAPLVAQIALDAMLGVPLPDGEIFMPADLPVREGPDIAIFCDANCVAEHVATPDKMALAGTHIGAIIQQGSPVYADGRLIGHAMFEVMTLVVDGVLKQMSGQPSMRAGIKRLST
jgi:hypothetical protein